MSLAAAVHAVDYYLDEEQEKERHHILELWQLDDAESAEVLLGYARETLRELPILDYELLLMVDVGFNPRLSILWRNVTADAQIPQGRTKCSSKRRNFRLLRIKGMSIPASFCGYFFAAAESDLEKRIYEKQLFL